MNQIETGQQPEENDFNDIDLQSEASQSIVSSPFITDQTGEISSISKIRSAEQNQVYKIVAENGEFVLKLGPKLKKEHDNLAWLANKLPVPQVLAWEESKDEDKLLTSFVEGEDLAMLVKKMPAEDLVNLLANALKQIHSLDISEYPERDENSSGVFIHGDACLPNFIIKDGKLAGLIDLGDAGIGETETDLTAAVWSLSFNYGNNNLGISFLSAYGIENPTEKYVDELIQKYEEMI